MWNQIWLKREPVIATDNNQLALLGYTAHITYLSSPYRSPDSKNKPEVLWHVITVWCIIIVRNVQRMDTTGRAVFIRSAESCQVILLPLVLGRVYWLVLRLNTGYIGRSFSILLHILLPLFNYILFVLVLLKSNWVLFKSGFHNGRNESDIQ